MKISSWFSMFNTGLRKKTPDKSPPQEKTIVLNFRHYPELRDLQKAGAT